jgi:glucose/arabinose dehydrogenase
VSNLSSRPAPIAHRLCLTATLLVAALVTASCTGTSPTPGQSQSGASTPTAQAAATSPGTVGSEADTSTGTAAATSIPSQIQVRTIATDLQAPWGLGFLPDGTAIVTERDEARVSAISPTGAVSELGVIAGVAPGGEGGLLGVAVSPAFAQDQLLYVYYSADDENRVATVTLRDGSLDDQRDILTGIPRASTHNGGRLRFGPDGMLYIGTGESGDRPLAQDLSSLGGKILRLTPDGSPAPGNPFPEAPLVYSYGHRNVQGLAFDPQGRLWASEFGQNTWDELNLIQAGGNYGWPEQEGQGGGTDFVQPQRVWPTSEASPSGVAVLDGSVWMAGLRGARLWQIPESGDGTLDPVPHLAGEHGRLRTVEPAPDGSLWVMTSNTDGRGQVRDGDDRILRITVS